MPRHASAGFRVVLGLLGAASVMGCTEPQPKNLLLVIADTLRADALHCYGGHAWAPNLCGLAEQGVLFENAYANGSWTLPSSVALLTGSYASGFGRDGEIEGRDAFYYVDDQEQLLAEDLRERGYRTLAFVENHLAAKPNSLQGFETILLQSVDWGDRRGTLERLGLDPGPKRNRRMLPALEYLLRTDDSDFFILQWIMDPHAIYSPPPRFAARLRVHSQRLPRDLVFYSRLEAGGDEERNTGDLNTVGPTLDDYELATLRQLYQREVESVDARVGAMLKALEERELLGQTVVVFTSDHGEGFGEHGKFLHASRWLYDEFIRIPLIMAGPGVKSGLRVKKRVSLVDVVPTLRELLDIPPGLGEQGHSFASLLRGAEAKTENEVYVVDRSAQGLHDALIDGPFKAIGHDDQIEIYDLAEDPDEAHDLSGERPDLRSRLSAQLDRQRSENERRRLARSHLTDSKALERAARQTRQQLRALGYIDDETSTEKPAP
ncbi:sulfatase [Myxococcota bacterium]|nr:sulfatase [Myxococcota bacterium]